MPLTSPLDLPANIWRTGWCFLAFCTLSTGLAAPAQAQWDAPIQISRAPLTFGEVTLDATLNFRWAEGWIGGPTFAETLERDDALSLFDPTGQLSSALGTLGAGSSPLIAGGTSAAVQASQTRVPLTLRAGMPWGLELEATMRFVRTRLEADTRLLSSASATLGRSPALDDPTPVQEFVDEVVAATAGFSAGGRDWEAWGEAWRAAYRASVLFPATGSDAATRLLGELDALNTALAADGRAPVGRSPLFAAVPLTPEGYLGLTSGAPYGLTSFEAAPFLWRNGDVDVVLHRRLGGADANRPWALRASGGVRIPVAQQVDPDLPFSTAAGPGVIAALIGADGWYERGRLTASGSLRATFNGSREVAARIGPVDQVFIGRDSRTGVNWTPGARILGHLRGEFAPSGSLRLEAGYSFDLRMDDSYERLGPVPDLDGTQAFPSPPFYGDATLLGEGTGGAVHWARGGVRWVPSSPGAFGISLDVSAPVAGEIPRSFEWTELRLRVHRTLNLSGLFD